MIFDTSYKTLIGVKPFCIRIVKVEELIRVYDGTKYLVLFGSDGYYAN